MLEWTSKTVGGFPVTYNKIIIFQVNYKAHEGPGILGSGTSQFFAGITIYVT